VGAGVVRGSRQELDTVEDIRIRSLPTLYGLMQDARFPINQIRAPGERIAAEHDMVLRPVLRNSGVPRRSTFLRADTRHKYEKRHTHSNSNSSTSMPWLHSYLRLRLNCRYCSRFSVYGITDFGPLALFCAGTFRSFVPRR
jgi:hypothetical protein